MRRDRFDVHILSRYIARFASPFAIRNSVKVMGSICMKLTFLPGKRTVSTELGSPAKNPHRQCGTGVHSHKNISSH